MQYQNRGLLARSYSSAVHRNNLRLYSIMFKISRTALLSKHSRMVHFSPPIDYPTYCVRHHNKKYELDHSGSLFFLETTGKWH